MNRLIAYTFFLPCLLIFLLWCLFHFYEPSNENLLFEKPSIRYKETETHLFGVDAQDLYLSYYKILDQITPPPLLIFIADSQLDRNWNAPHFSFKSGLWLGKTLARHGIANIRYDQRGTGKSFSNSSIEKNLNLKLDDLRTITEFALKERYSNLYFLAHGNEACGLLLYAIQKWSWQRKIHGLILIGCGGEGNLVDLWASKLFFNMERQGIKPNDMTQAKSEWDDWIKNSISNKDTLLSQKMDKKASSDLKAFRLALSIFSKPEWSAYRNLGSKINIQKYIASFVSENMNILHLQSLYDEERPEEERNSTRKYAQFLEKKKKNYTFIELKQSDYFLKKQRRIYSGFPLVFTRLNPFRSLDEEAPIKIREFCK